MFGLALQSVKGKRLTSDDPALNRASLAKLGNFRKTRFKGLHRTELASYLVGAAYNLIRMAKLIDAPAA